MKVFNGNEFLKSRECTIKLSDGTQHVVKDLSDTAMDALGKLDESTSMANIRTVVAETLRTDVESLKDIGVVELQGALNFLSQSLFVQK